MKKTITLLAIAFYTNIHSQNLCFSSAANFAASTGPFSVAIADFNGDGKKDLATANDGSANVSILLGTGTGSFSTAVSFTVGSQPHSVISADFNGDAIIDLATSNYTANNVSILLGTGTGSFGFATNFPAGTNPFAVAVADFNGDGKKDLATANYFINSVSVLIGDGIGGFGTVTSFTVNGPQALINADFNGDGFVDLATDNAFILLGNGAGSFTTVTTFSVATGPTFVNSADFNGDGKLDLALTNHNFNNVSVLLNCNSLGISNYMSEEEIKIYPNPSIGTFIIESSFSEKQTIQIFDVNGRLVLCANVNNKSNIDATNLGEGIYTLTIKAADSVINKKLVIIR